MSHIFYRITLTIYSKIFEFNIFYFSLGNLSAIPETSPPHEAMRFPRGIDHFGALKHWGVFLFFFLVGIMLFSNWSLHSRLSQIEETVGISAKEPFMPKTGEPTQFVQQAS